MPQGTLRPFPLVKTLFLTFQSSNSLTKSESSTVLIVESTLDPASPKFTLRVSYSGETICPSYFECSTCALPSDCEEFIQDYDMFEHHSVGMYGTHLLYECPLAEKFEYNTTYLAEYQEMQCEWDGIWSPSSTLKPCVRKCLKKRRS